MLSSHLQLLKKIQQDVISRWAITLIEIALIALFWWFNLIGRVTVFVAILLSSVILLNILIHFVILKRRKIPPLSEYIIKLIDIALITYVIWFTGAINSPFYIIYMLMILLEGLSLRKNYVNYDFLLSVLCYTGLVLVVDVRIITNRVMITPALIITLSSRITFMFLAHWAALSYVKILMLQRKELEDSNAENIRLYEKVRQFNSELSAKVKAATSELRKSSEENASLYMKYHGLFISMTKALATAVSIRDPYYARHAGHVTEYSLAILEELTLLRGFELPPELRGTLYLAGTLHDVGRIALSDSTIKNPGSLTDTEWKEMRQTPVIGARIIGSIKELEQVSKGILHHHERFDGAGYPDGLKGREIPLVSRILSISDAFEAMTSERSFRGKLTDKEALEEIKKNSGSQFDPVIVNAFMKAYEKSKISTN
ncbi:MAG: HD domain-containing phosphohydrolase [bacterium]